MNDTRYFRRGRGCRGEKENRACSDVSADGLVPGEGERKCWTAGHGSVTAATIERKEGKRDLDSPFSTNRGELLPSERERAHKRRREAKR